jgi:hypothetical protein
MLFVIELIFLVTGVWALVSGRLPSALFRLLFGKGDYSVPANQARWYGLLLASPLPASFATSSLLAALLGEGATRPAIAFEFFYLIAVIIASMVIARRIRRSPEPLSSGTLNESAQAPQPARSYGTRLLIILALAILTCVALAGLAMLAMATVALTRLGPGFTAELPQALPSLLLSAGFIAIGAIGVLYLLRLLRS